MTVLYIIIKSSKNFIPFESLTRFLQLTSNNTMKNTWNSVIYRYSFCLPCSEQLPPRSHALTCHPTFITALQLQVLSIILIAKEKKTVLQLKEDKRQLFTVSELDSVLFKTHWQYVAAWTYKMVCITVSNLRHLWNWTATVS